MLQRFLVSATLTILAATERAHAEEERARPRSMAVHGHQIVGAKAVYVLEIVNGESERGRGLALFWETTLPWESLALELGALWVQTARGVSELGFEPLLKAQLHVTDLVEPYVGAGPVLLWNAEHERLRRGGQVVAGSYLWPHPRFGVDMDVAFALLSGPRTPVYELTVAMGPMLRF